MRKLDPNQIRKIVLEMAYTGASVHIPCAFSIVEILTVLYNKFIRLPDSKDPSYNGTRDYLVLSKGHGVMALYACLKEFGILSDSDIKNYFKDGTSLKGLCDAHVKGVEVTSGSLGHGLSVGVGLALASKLKKTDQKVFAIIGDGEANEGSIWEAIMFASHFKLSNLWVIVDANKFQAMGTTKEVLDMGNLKEKFESFGFYTVEVDGHDFGALEMAISNGLEAQNNFVPKAIIAHTVKGKGVDFMENNNEWHYTRLTLQDYESATSQIG